MNKLKLRIKTNMLFLFLVSPKVVDGQMSAEAHLVAIGFGEDQNIRSYSPTCLQEGERPLMALKVSNNWNIGSIDKKCEFLQRYKTDRDIM